MVRIMVEHKACLHEDEIQTHSRKVEALEVRADYKDQRLDEFNESMKELQKSVDGLNKTINDYIVKSINDDNNLKEYISSLENRVTALEAEKKNTRYMIGVVAIILAAIEFGLKYLH